MDVKLHRSNYRWWLWSKVKKNNVNNVLETYGVRCRTQAQVKKAMHGRFFLKEDEKCIITRDYEREKEEDKKMTQYQQNDGAVGL
jgi:hypothetical protein